MVPKGWKNKFLKEITTWNSGGTPSMRVNSHWNGDIPWITASTMQGHAFETSTKFITKEGLKSGSKLAEKDSLLLLVRGSMLWNKIPVGIAKRDLAFNQDVKSVVANSVLLPLFLLYWFLANENKLLHMVTGTGIGAGKLDTNELLSLKMALPPLPEQKKIAKILSTWDRAIEVTEKLLESSRQQKKSLMQQLLTGKKRLPGFSGEWKELSLSKLTKIYDGTHTTPKYVEKGIPFYSVEHLTSNNFTNTKYISEEVFDKENKRVKLEKGDILMTRIGDIGTTKYLNWDVEASFYVSLALIKSNNSFSAEFLSYYMAGEDFQRELWKRIIHVAFPKKINLGEIGNCIVYLPSQKEQQKIASVLSVADKEIEVLQKKLDCLRQEKKALMQQLLTGKRRVKIDETSETKGAAG